MPGYSGTPLAKKLGIKTGCRVMPVNAPAEYRAWLEPMPEGVRFEARLSPSRDILHVFSRDRAELGGLLKAYRTKLKPTGSVWVSWPKKSATVPTDIKVCAVSEIWSGLKLVVRKELR